MKKKRPQHLVEFRMYPKAGSYQLCYLDISYRPFVFCGSLAPQRSLLGPFLLDVHHNTFVNPKVYKVPVSLFQQGPAITKRDKHKYDRDTSLTHNYATGVLIEGNSVCTEYIHSVQPSTLYPNHSVDCTSAVLKSQSPGGTPEEFLRVYYLGSSQIRYDYYDTLFVNGVKAKLIDSEKTVVETLQQHSNVVSTSYCVNYTDESGFSQILKHTGRTVFKTDDIEPISSVELDYCFLSYTSEWRVSPNPEGKQITKGSGEITATILPVSPVVETAFDCSDELPYSVRASVFDIQSDIKSLIKQTPDDADFLSVRQAVDSMSICRINGLAFMKDLQEIKALIEPIITILRKPLVIKNWASLALWHKYGITLSIQDTKTLVEGIKNVRKLAKSLRDYAKYRNSLMTRYGTSKSPIETHRFKGTSRACTRLVARLEVPAPLTALAGWELLMSDFDFRITTENLWDLIPYSFVIDWFLGIGDFLNQVDYRLEIKKLHVRDRTYSFKNVVRTKPSAFYSHNFFGNLRLSTYSRGVLYDLPAPPWRLGAPSFLKHIWEGFLLILVNKK